MKILKIEVSVKNKKKYLIESNLQLNIFSSSNHLTKKKYFDLESIFKFMKKLSYLSDFRVFLELSSGYQRIYPVSYYQHSLLVLY